MNVAVVPIGVGVMETIPKTLRKRLGGAGDPRKTLDYPDNGTNENNYNAEVRTGIVKRLTVT